MQAESRAPLSPEPSEVYVPVGITPGFFAGDNAAIFTGALNLSLPAGHDNIDMLPGSCCCGLDTQTQISQGKEMPKEQQ